MKGIYSWIDWMPFSFIEKTLGRYILDTGSATYRFGLLFPLAVSTKANLCASQLFSSTHSSFQLPHMFEPLPAQLASPFDQLTVT
jgi:hypothetical protein